MTNIEMDIRLSENQDGEYQNTRISDIFQKIFCCPYNNYLIS